MSRKRIVVWVGFLSVGFARAQSLEFDGKNGGRFSIEVPKDFVRDDFSIPGFSDRHTVASFRHVKDAKTFLSVTAIPRADFSGKKWGEIVAFIRGIECEGRSCGATQAYGTLEGYCREIKGKRSAFSLFKPVPSGDPLLFIYTKSGGNCAELDPTLLRSFERFRVVKP